MSNTNTQLKKNADIHRFIKSIIEKNYSAANKYLSGVVNSKLKTRIRNSASKDLF